MQITRRSSLCFATLLLWTLAAARSDARRASSREMPLRIRSSQVLHLGATAGEPRPVTAGQLRAAGLKVFTKTEGDRRTVVIERGPRFDEPRARALNVFTQAFTRKPWNKPGDEKILKIYDYQAYPTPQRIPRTIGRAEVGTEGYVVGTSSPLLVTEMKQRRLPNGAIELSR